MNVDVVVVGAGPAGIAAATRAAESGLDTLLVDEGVRAGGQIWRHAQQPPHGVAARWIARLHASGASVLHRTTIVDATYDTTGTTLAALRDGDAVRRLEAETVVLATGARELLLPFPGWTLPGVIGVGGAQALLKSGWNVRDLRIVIAGSGPLLLPVAAALGRAGARMLAVAEQAGTRPLARFAAGLWRDPARLLDAVRYRAAFARTPYVRATWPVRVDMHGGGAPLRVTLTNGSTERVLECDVLCAGFGLVPASELAALLGCALDDDRVGVDDLQRTSLHGVLCAGEPTGVAGVDAAIVEGEIAGLVAAGRAAAARPLLHRRDSHRRLAQRMHAAFALRPELAALPDADTIVCRCEDVTSAVVERCSTLREAKLLARAGMGACQGRVCGPALRFRYGWPRDTVRPPVVPASVEQLSRFTDPSEA